ncbi:CARDB domain-containing protein, partial [Crocosphaera watsonii]|uniref:CARDB domain-containing protein n=1 Tax=Crocosphaera watsonii TaxID=263511 RepID=UPI000651E23C
TLTLDSSRTKYIGSETTLNNAGTIIWKDGRIEGDFTNKDDIINNTGIFEIKTGDSDEYIYYITFNNDGTIIKSQGTGTNYFTRSSSSFNNRGLVDIQSGHISFSTLVNVSGSIEENGGTYSIDTLIDNPLLPDLEFVSIDVPEIIKPDTTVAVSWVVKNIGNTDILTSQWYDAVYVSDDTVLDSSDLFLQRIQNNFQVTINGEYTFDSSLVIPETEIGLKYLLFVTDAKFNQLEENENNNIISQQVSIQTVINESPTDVEISNNLVNENSPNNAVIGTLSTIDPNLDDTHTYRLLDSAEGRFYIDGNQLKVANGTLLNFEETSSYDIKVQTIDPAGLSFDKTLTIDLQNVNENPTDIILTSNNIAENSPIDTVIGELETIDVDASDTHTYELIDDALGRFKLDNNKIQVADSSLLNFEENNSYEITVKTRDAEELELEKVLKINIADVNESPTAINLSNNSVDENSNDDTFIGYFSTDDPDDSENHSYTLINDAQGIFKIEGNELRVADGSLLDFEENTSHIITVETKDKGDLTLTQDFSITLNDLNESDLTFAWVNVPETANFGEFINIEWQVNNIGDDSTLSSWTDVIYLSTDSEISDDDEILESIINSQPLDANNNYTQTINISLPLNDESVPGTYYLLGKTDIFNNEIEINETNNSSDNDLRVIQLSIPPLPDLVTQDIQVPNLIPRGDDISISWRTLNIGDADINTSWTESIYLSSDSTLNNATFLTNINQDKSLANDGFIDTTIDINRSDIIDGDYQIIIVTDVNNNIYERDGETNNITVSETITISHPDLIPEWKNAPAIATSGDTLNLSYSLTNQGLIDITNQWKDQVYLSTDQQLDNDDQLLEEIIQIGGILGNNNQDYSVDVTLPLEISGDYYLLLATDVDNNINEFSDENNNLVTSAINVELVPHADLEVSNVIVPALTIGNPVPVTFEWTVTNIGTGSSNSDQWTDQIIASRDGTFGNSDDFVLGEFIHTGSLENNQQYQRQETILLPSNFEGRYRIFIQSDVTDNVFENNKKNNNIGTAINFMDIVDVPYSDLAVTELITESIGQSGENLSISWTVANLSDSNGGQGIGITENSNWNDIVYLSSDSQGNNIIPGTVQIFDHKGALALDSSYERNVDFSIPDGLTGTYYVVVETTGSYDFIYTNNNKKVSNEPITINLSESPDLRVKDIITPTNVQAGDVIDITWQVTNQGTGNATDVWTDKLQLREAGKTDGEIIDLRSFTYNNQLEAGKFYTRTEQITLPETIQGIYEIVITTNTTNSLYEHNATANNTTIDNELLTIGLPPRPDLQVQDIITPDTVSAGGNITVEFIVLNQGEVATNSPKWQDKVYLSLDGELSSDDIIIGTLENGSALGSKESYRSISEPLTIPRYFRNNAYIIVETDSNNVINEYPQEENNTLVKQININSIPPADLVTSNVISPDQVFEGNEIEVRFTVTNKGIGETDRDSWTDTVWLTRDPQRPSTKSRESSPEPNDIEDFILGSISHNGSLAVGESYEQVITVNIPEIRNEFFPNGLSGNWYITPWSDAYDVVLEDTLSDNINPDDPNEIDNNNYKGRPITVLSGAPADVIVTSIIPTQEALAGDEFTVQWTVENQSTTATPNSWVDEIYLSDSPNLYEGKQWLLAEVEHQGVLQQNENYSKERTVTLNPAAQGQYIIVKTGGRWEGDRQDNSISSVDTNVTNQPSDLIVTNITTPQESFSGEKAVISWTVENQGATVWEGTRYWEDHVYLSTDPRLTIEQLSSSRSESIGSFVYSPTTPLETGDSYTQTAEVTLPRGIEGDYYIYIVSNSNSFVHYLSQYQEDNNESALEQYSDRVFEDFSNNLFLTSIPVTYREPDLQVTNLTPSITDTVSGQTITVDWTVSNLGTRDTRQTSWIDRVYLSRDPSLDESDQQLGSFIRRSQKGLSQGDDYTVNLDVDLPDGIQGDYYLLAYSDSNIAGYLPPQPAVVDFEAYIDPYLARVGEYKDEGNNITATPINITLATPPDLQVLPFSVAERAIVGQTFDLTYTVQNNSLGDTPSKQGEWRDLIYLSRDEFLDLDSDRYLDYVDHKDGLLAGENYTINKTLTLPKNISGSYYVFVVTDPANYQNRQRGQVFEGENETNNATPSDRPLIVELPPPTDLQVDTITLPSGAQTGDNITLEWTVFNRSEEVAEGRWTDAVYLSTDATWDIEDRPIGRVIREDNTPLQPGEFYTAQLQTSLPPITPGQYRVIVRPDIFDQVEEGENEVNNRTASADPLTVSVPSLQLGVRSNFDLDQQQVYQVEVPLGQTLKVTLDGLLEDGANELFVRFGDVPTDVVYDAAYQGPLAPDQTAIIPTTKPGTYYILVRGQSENPVNLLAELVPFTVENVSTDQGGDSRYVTTTITGAQFHEDALVKLVRPGFAEYEPVNYEVIDSTRIKAIFDFRDAPRGLYDVKVINPNGDTAILPYRYLIERAMEPDIDIGLGGPRVLAPGNTGTYGVSVVSTTNIDTPYTHFQFGIPELGVNEVLFGLDYVRFSSNLRGTPEIEGLQTLPWASLASEVNTTGEILAPGYITDLPTGEWVGQTFRVETYPGLQAILDQNFNQLLDKLRNQFADDPDSLAIVNSIQSPEDLDLIAPPDGEFPGLTAIYESQGSPLADIEDEDIAFQFHILASATALTRDEFIEQQTQEALKLRQAILNDADASQGLAVLAANEQQWIQGYLASLEMAGLLRPEDTAPPVREEPLVLSLMATLATGILAGPVGNQIITNDNLIDFFKQIRQWYGHDAELIGQNTAPDLEPYDLNLTYPTHSEAFDIYVPYGSVKLDLPTETPLTPPNWATFLNSTGETNQLASITGPFGQGEEGFVSGEATLPYTINFSNPATATSEVGEIRIVTELDEDLDPLTFALGDLQIGDIQVSIPNSRASFEGTFNFVNSKGFLLRVSAGIDVATHTATWLLQAIDPNTGEAIANPDLGLLPPDDASGAGKGFVTYQIKPKTVGVTGTEITSEARILLNTQAPLDTPTITHTLDSQAPTSQLNVTPIGIQGNDYLVEWQAEDDSNGSGVRHITVYVAKDGGAYEIWQQQTQETSGVYQGEAGHTYEFLAIATDNAGNKEDPTLGTQVPDDGSSVNLGNLPSVGQTSQDLPPAPKPSAEPSTNDLFTAAEALIPSSVPTTRPSQFETVLEPFKAQSLVTGIGSSGAGIGAMAIALRDDGSAIISGGSARNELFIVPREGKEVGQPWVSLSEPIFDLEFDNQGNLWATSGGGALLQLDPTTGAIVEQYGESLTQSLAIAPDTGYIYVSSGDGIEVFDPIGETFTHYSDLRVGNLTFDKQGQLWAALWPDRGDVIRFNEQNKAETMLSFDTPLDSLAFGETGTSLEGLLFISDNSGQLLMVDMATLRHVVVASGGSRGDIVKTTNDGRVLLSQGQQVEVLNPIIAPQVVATNPSPNSQITLPHNTILVTFDQDMFIGDSSNENSVLNPLNFQLTGESVGTFIPQQVQYDSSSRTALVIFDAIIPDRYELLIESDIQSVAGLEMDADYSGQFTAISDFLAVVDFEFSNPRLDRSQQTLSYEVSLTNTADYDLLLPAFLLLDPAQGFSGTPLNSEQNEDGAYLLDLSDSLPDGLFKPGQIITGQIISVENPDNLRVELAPGIYALPTSNQVPIFISNPLTEATIGEVYTYQVTANDPDGIALTYLLYDAPEGMIIDGETGLMSWTPTGDSLAETEVMIRVYDSRGGHETQSFTIAVEGGNHQPIIDPLPDTIEGAEGEILQIPIFAFDEDNDALIYYAENLPNGALFDPNTQLFTWQPDFNAAGTYENVTFSVSDGISSISQTTKIRIAPINQSPTLIIPEKSNHYRRTRLHFTTVRK